MWGNYLLGELKIKGTPFVLQNDLILMSHHRVVSLLQAVKPSFPTDILSADLQEEPLTVVVAFPHPCEASQSVFISSLKQAPCIWREDWKNGEARQMCMYRFMYGRTFVWSVLSVPQKTPGIQPHLWGSRQDWVMVGEEMIFLCRLRVLNQLMSYSTHAAQKSLLLQFVL